MGANIITVCCSLSYMLICSMCYVSMVRLCYVSIFSLCSVSIFSMCYVSMHASLASLGGSSLRSLRPLRGRCGRFAVAAAASRPQAITPNIIVFIVHSLTFMNVSALVTWIALDLLCPPLPSFENHDQISCDDLRARHPAPLV